MFKVEFKSFKLEFARAGERKNWSSLAKTKQSRSKAHLLKMVFPPRYEAVQYRSYSVLCSKGRGWKQMLELHPPGGGDVLQISSVCDDRMEAKIKTPKNP